MLVRTLTEGSGTERPLEGYTVLMLMEWHQGSYRKDVSIGLPMGLGRGCLFKIGARRDKLHHGLDMLIRSMVQSESLQVVFRYGLIEEMETNLMMYGPSALDPIEKAQEKESCAALQNSAQKSAGTADVKTEDEDKENKNSDTKVKNETDEPSEKSSKSMADCSICSEFLRDDVQDNKDLPVGEMYGGEAMVLVMTLMNLNANQDMLQTFNELSCMMKVAVTKEIKHFDRAKEHKERGNVLFKEGKVDEAFRCYGKAAKNLIAMSPDSFLMPDWKQPEYTQLKCQLYLNLSACQLQKKNFPPVIVNCTKALSLDSKAIKAYFRRAQAYTELDQYEEAERDLLKVLELEPSNKPAEKQLDKVRRSRRGRDGSLAKGLGKMFAGKT